MGVFVIYEFGQLETMLTPFKSVAVDIFIVFWLLNYFSVMIYFLFISVWKERRLLTLKGALWFDYFHLKVQSSILFFSFLSFLLISLHITFKRHYGKRGPQVRRKVFNIYSLIHLTFFLFFFGNLLCHHFINYLI